MKKLSWTNEILFLFTTEWSYSCSVKHADINKNKSWCLQRIFSNLASKIIQYQMQIYNVIG